MPGLMQNPGAPPPLLPGRDWNPARAYGIIKYPITKQEGREMSFFRKPDAPSIPYDRETRVPAVRSSICTGEMTVGFLERKTGKFHEYALARSQRDVDDFCRRVGIEPKDLKRIY